MRWILTGSLVLIAHGARSEPGDVDLTPTLDQRNLDAIAAVLEELRSIPPHNSRFAECPPLDWHYAWLPRPATIYNLNMLHATTRGVLDVVPWNCGSYDELVRTAKPLDVGGYEILVAHPSTVFQHLEGRNREKDVSRRDDYDRIRRSIEVGTLALTGLDHSL